MATIAEAWASFEATVVPAAAGETQRRETRIAFYAGATAALSMAVRLGMGADTPEQEVLAATQLEAMGVELTAFAEDVGAGRV